MTTNRDDLFHVVANLALAIQGASTYPENHPKVQEQLLRLYRGIQSAMEQLESLNIGFFADHIVVDEHPFVGLNPTLERLNERVREKGIEKVVIRQEITFGEIKRFVYFLGDAGENAEEERWEAISYGKIENVGGARTHTMGLAPSATPSNILAGATDLLKDVLVSLAAQEGNTRLNEGRDIVSSVMKGLRQEGLLIDRLIRLQFHDDYTVTHSLNVCVLVVAFAGHIGLPENRIREIGLAALLHDIGKEMIATGILNKPGRLDLEEFDHIKTHPVAGARILRRVDCGSDLPMIVAFEHHIKYDRSGYPKTRSTAPVHTASFMTQLADVYDAIRCYRPYQKSVDVEKSLSIMRQGRGTDFEPELFDAFIRMIS